MARVVLPVAASLLGLLTLRLLGPEWVSQERMEAWLTPMGHWAPLAFITFLVVRPITLLPGQLFAAVGGMLFGLWAGVTYALVGSLLSSLLVFWLARRHGRARMERWVGSDYRALSESARRHDFAFTFAGCINPLAPTDLLLALAASTGARVVPSVLGVLLGTVPGTLLTVAYGSALGRGQTWGTVLSAAGLLVSLAVGAWVARRVYREVLSGREARGPAGEPSAAPGPGGPPGGEPGGASGDEGPEVPEASAGERTAVSRGTSRSTSAPVSFPPPRVT